MWYNDLVDDLIDAAYNSGYYAGRCIDCDFYVRSKYNELGKIEIERQT